MAPPTKRTLEEGESILEGVKALVLDIEGTITPISFVKDKLFPYVTENLESYLSTRYDEDETQEDMTALRALAAKDKEGCAEVVEIPDKKDDNKDDVIKAAISNVKALMDADSKATELKCLQGHMWREAYKTKKIEGELFEDVAPVLQQIAEEAFMLYIYSSGSVEAQKLLLAHSSDGDITDIFMGFFDTTQGPKTESESYKNIKKLISEEHEVEPEEILFLTDNPAEGRAACNAGWQAVLIDRSMEQEGSIDITQEDRKNFMVMESLNDLFGEDDDDEEAQQQQQMKRPRIMDGNGEYAGEDDDDDDDDPEGLDDDDEVTGDFGEEEGADDDDEEEEA